jgi:cytochrome c peroxidase
MTTAGPRHLPLRSQDLTRGGIGNCAACHPAPRFTDFEFHNTGAAQNEYDAIHGTGAFFALFIPDLRTRNRSPETWLPPSPAHPRARGPFLSVPAADRPGHTDLGLWNVFANPPHPRPQARIRRILCDDGHRCRNAALLEEAIARFKTPGLRDLGHSGPYLHTGQADTLEQVVGLYGRFAALVRAGTMRNPAPQLAGIALVPDDVRALAAFLRALNEDYE